MDDVTKSIVMLLDLAIKKQKEVPVPSWNLENGAMNEIKPEILNMVKYLEKLLFSKTGKHLDKENKSFPLCSHALPTKQTGYDRNVYNIFIYKDYGFILHSNWIKTINYRMFSLEDGKTCLDLSFEEGKNIKFYTDNREGLLENIKMFVVGLNESAYFYKTINDIFSNKINETDLNAFILKYRDDESVLNYMLPFLELGNNDSNLETIIEKCLLEKINVNAITLQNLLSKDKAIYELELKEDIIRYFPIFDFDANEEIIIDFIPKINAIILNKELQKNLIKKEDAFGKNKI